MTPPVLRIPGDFVRGSCSFAQVIARRGLQTTAWRYDLCPTEIRFARILLSRHPKLWMYRTDQQAFAGDFLLVDMSSPDPDRRRLWAIELKMNAEIKVGGGGAGNQFVSIERAVAALVARGIAKGEPKLVVGDGDALCDWFSGGTP